MYYDNWPQGGAREAMITCEEYSKIPGPPLVASSGNVCENNFSGFSPSFYHAANSVRCLSLFMVFCIRGRGGGFHHHMGPYSNNLETYRRNASSRMPMLVFTLLIRGELNVLNQMH